MDLVPVIRDEGLTVWRGVVQGASGPLTVIFNSRIRAHERPDFIGSVARARRPALILCAPRRTWFADRDSAQRIEAAVRAEMVEIGSDEVDTLGFSMGGWAALAWAERLPVRHAVAFAPRFSPDPARVPDRRHEDETRALAPRLMTRDAAPGMARARWSLILHGTLGPDLSHLRRFPRSASGRGEHWIAPGVGHRVAAWLHEQGEMAEVIRAGLAGEAAAVGAALGRARAVRRDSLSGRWAVGSAVAARRLRRILRRVGPQAEGET